jgi:DNA-binding transcriptional ArsR family regulator
LKPPSSGSAAAREATRSGSKPRSPAAPSPDVDSTLAALADPYRRRVVNLLRQRPHAAGELAQQLELPAPAMSRHLRVLRQSGLVEERHPEFDARVRIYSLRLEPMAGLKAWLEETEQLWADQLGALKSSAEAPPRS